MPPDRWLFWHRRDLRLSDNLGLAAAAAATPAVTGVFVLDPALLAAPELAPARRWFLRESLAELEESWRRAGSRLLLLQGDPALLLPRLAGALGAGVVAWNRDVEPYGRERDRRVSAALQADGRRVLFAEIALDRVVGLVDGLGEDTAGRALAVAADRIASVGDDTLVSVAEKTCSW